MPGKSFKVDIVTPEKTIYSGSAFSMVIPSESGYLGILAGHAALIANTVSGRVTLDNGSKERLDIMVKAKGFVEVSGNSVNLLLDEAC